MNASAQWADSFRRRLIEAQLARPEEIEGCSSAEIEKLAKSAGVQSLPSFYAEWLRAVGRSAGSFLRGSVAFYPELLQLRADAAEMMGESGRELEANAVVCLEHQGYEFAYFLAIPGLDNPPVSLFIEGMAVPETRWPSISMFLDACLEDERRESRR